MAKIEVSLHGKKMEKAQNPMIWKAKFCSCEYTTVKFTKTAIKFLGVQAAKKCTAPNRCEEREKR